MTFSSPLLTWTFEIFDRRRVKLHDVDVHVLESDMHLRFIVENLLKLRKEGDILPNVQISVEESTEGIVICPC